MSNKVVVIGLDSADSQLIKRWASAGHLPQFSQLLQEGAYADIRSSLSYGNNSKEECCTTEVLWTSFLTSCKPSKTGFWSITDYSPDSYSITSSLTDCSYDYAEFPLFYALGEQYRVASFNVPSSAISDQVNGVQLLGWAGHFPGVRSQAHPPELIESIIEKYGENPILFKDDGIWWDKKYIEWEKQAIKSSVRTQSRLYQNFLKDNSLDLFLGAFSELHTAGHDLYAHSETDHPLYPYLRTGDYQNNNPLRDAYQEIDAALGKILNEVTDDTYFLVFSPHGIGPNFSDLLSHLFLPEFLYRFSFPGQTIIPGKIKRLPHPIKTDPFRNGWTAETWTDLYESNFIEKYLKKWTPRQYLTSSYKGLRSPFSSEAQQSDQSWMPAMWYQPLWPQMQAFALPGFANGHIRINLQGREKEGIVPLSEYDAVCLKITDFLHRLKDGRTDRPIVKKVVRTRLDGSDNEPKTPHPDLVVYWNENTTDVIDSPDFGRVGPVTYSRAGTHYDRGFLMLKGPGIEPGEHLPTADIVDLAPTILELLGARIPNYFDGQSMLRSITSRKTLIEN